MMSTTRLHAAFSRFLRRVWPRTPARAFAYVVVALTVVVLIAVCVYPTESFVAEFQPIDSTSCIPFNRLIPVPTQEDKPCHVALTTGAQFEQPVTVKKGTEGMFFCEDKGCQEKASMQAVFKDYQTRHIGNHLCDANQNHKNIVKATCDMKKTVDDYNDTLKSVEVDNTKLKNKRDELRAADAKLRLGLPLTHDTKVLVALPNPPGSREPVLVPLARPYPSATGSKDPLAGVNYYVALNKKKQVMYVKTQGTTALVRFSPAPPDGIRTAGTDDVDDDDVYAEASEVLPPVQAKLWALFNLAKPTKQVSAIVAGALP